MIAIDLPNRDLVNPDWRQYQTSIHRIELATGHQFLSNLPVALQGPLKVFLGWGFTNNIIPFWNLTRADLSGANLSGALNKEFAYGLPKERQ